MPRRKSPWISKPAHLLPPITLETVLASFGRAEQAINAIREANPDLAKALETAISVAAGGAVKTAAMEAANYAMMETFGNEIQEMTTLVNHAIGGYITDTGAEAFGGYVAHDQQNGSNGPLGSSTADISDGISFVTNTLLGIGGNKGSNGQSSSAAQSNNNGSGIQNQNGTVTVSNNTGGFVDLSDPQRRTHILEGDSTGGGHRAGAGSPGKTEFPQGWTDDRIMHEISDIATDPNSNRRNGRGGRTITEGTRDGVDIRVIQENNGDIVTGFPTNLPRNEK